MYVSNRKRPHDSPPTSVGDVTVHRTIVLLDELLTHTIPLRDMYKGARCRAADIYFSHLCALFDTHYKEQLALVEMLVDRIRALGGASCVLAATFVQSNASSYALRGHLAPSRLLLDLLDAHEAVRNVAHTTGIYGLQTDPSAVRDYVVGQVLLTNDQQGRFIREQLVRLEQARRFSISSFSGVDACE